MRSLLITIALISFVCSIAAAQGYPTLSPTHPYTETAEYANSDAIIDSVQAAREKEWNQHLIINSDSRIDSLLQIHREENIRKNGIEGYRVQIFQGDKEEAYRMKARFISLHENIKAYVSFQAPDFRVRVGDFRTRSEAIKLRQIVKDEFAVSFIVDDIINFPELYVAEVGK